MTAILVPAGLALVAAAVLDAVVTTLAAGGGGGPITTRLASLTWRVLRATARGPLHGLLRFGGVVVLLTTVLTWVVLLWAGWTVVFISTEAAVVASTSGEPAGIAARVYYAGFVVFTLGVGDFVPGGGLWQVLTAVAAFVGLFIVTLSITYLVSVVSAAVSRRALAREITLYGETGEQIVRAHWDGDRLSQQLPSTIQTLTSQLLQVTQQHLAYPVLHHFHAADHRSAAPRALAALDDALVIVSEALPPAQRPGPDTILRLRQALEHYAETVGGSTDTSDGRPPWPAVDLLRRAGVPTLPADEFAAAAAEHRARRARLHQLVRADAWDWPTSTAV
jgi:hypothetical protein